MTSIEEYLENIDLDAIPMPDDKLKECYFYYNLLCTENDRAKFRWLLSAFLGSCYSFLEIKSKHLFFAFTDPDTGEMHEDENALAIFRQYVRAFKNKKNSSFIQTKALHALIKTLYEFRNKNTHHGALSIMQQGTATAENYLIGETLNTGVPAIKFCKSILFLFNEINEQLIES